MCFQRTLLRHGPGTSRDSWGTWEGSFTATEKGADGLSKLRYSTWLNQRWMWICWSLRKQLKTKCIFALKHDQEHSNREIRLTSIQNQYLKYKLEQSSEEKLSLQLFFLTGFLLYFTFKWILGAVCRCHNNKVPAGQFVCKWHGAWPDVPAYITGPGCHGNAHLVFK